jgi:hypothetical protein
MPVIQFKSINLQQSLITGEYRISLQPEDKREELK